MDSPADNPAAALPPATWRPPPATVTQQAMRLAAITVLAQRALAAVWPRIDWTDTDAAQKTVATYYRAITARYGRAAAAVAAEHYDAQRAAHRIRSAYIAIAADPVPDEQIAKIVESAFLGRTEPTPAPAAGPLTERPRRRTGSPQISITETPAPDRPRRQPRVTITETAPDAALGERRPRITITEEPAPTTSDLPVDQRVQDRLTRTLPRLVKQPARDTVAANTRRDPAEPSWIRVPTGEKTCEFCMMLASREPEVSNARTGKFHGYRSEMTALFNKLGEKYHDGCDCQAVAVWRGTEITDLSPNIREYQDIYYQASNAADTSTDHRKILYEMRKARRGTTSSEDRPPRREPQSGSSGGGRIPPTRFTPKGMDVPDEYPPLPDGSRIPFTPSTAPMPTPEDMQRVLSKHAASSTVPNKTRFPQDWSDQDIQDALELTIRRPSRAIERSGDKLTFERKIGNAVLVRVRIRTDGGNRFWTGYPART